MEKDLSSISLASVTLSIVSHGDFKKIRQLLDSLFSFEPKSKFQIILTDNLGTDLPDLDMTPDTSIIIIRNLKPQGFARNHNEAFRRADTNIFCILNPDVIFTQKIFDRLITLLETARADIVAPLIVNSNGEVQDSFRSLPTPLENLKRRLPGYHFSPLPPDADGLIHPDWIAGFFMLLKRETFYKINGFDEKYRLYFEDVDICTRARLLDMKLLVDTGCQAQHDGQRKSRKNLLHLFWHTQSALRFYGSSSYAQAVKRYGR